MNDDLNDPGSDLDPMPPDEQSTSDADPTVEAAAPAPPGSAQPARPSWKTWVAVASTAAVVGAAAVFGISAATSSDPPNAAATTQDNGAAAGQAPNGGQRQTAQNGPGGFGTISEIDGSSLSIEDPNGDTTKVITSSDTEVTTTVTGSVDDIQVGDTVMVVGTGSGAEIAATQVTDNGKVSDADSAERPGGGFRNGPPQGTTGNGAPGGGMRPAPDEQAPDGAAATTMTRGVVESVGDDTFTVTGINEDVVTVTTSSETTVSVTEAANVSDLEVGDTVMVVGDEADGTITATSIREGAQGPMIGGPRGGRPGAGPGTDSSGGASQ